MTTAPTLRRVILVEYGGAHPRQTQERLECWSLSDGRLSLGAQRVPSPDCPAEDVWLSTDTLVHAELWSLLEQWAQHRGVTDAVLGQARRALGDTLALWAPPARDRARTSVATG
jgi:hypothetical protein